METIFKLHYLNIGPGGKFKSNGQIQSSSADVDALFKHLETARHRKIILHFHGGLVPEKTGMETAERMVTTYSAAGHVYSIVWETGLMEVLQERFTKVQETGLFQELKKIVVRKVCEKLGIQDNTRGDRPLTEAEVEQELAAPQPFEKMETQARGGAERIEESELPDIEMQVEAELEEELDGGATLESYMQPDTLEGQRGFFTGGFFLGKLAKIVILVIKRFIRKRDHGLLPTTVEEILREFYLAEIGAVVWDGIKEKVRKGMWLPNAGLQNDDLHAGYYFLEKLNAFLGEHPGWKVDLVGHSAGSIAICHMLRSIAEEGFDHIKIRQIVLLAPACRTKLFHDEILNHPERYEQVRMFTMTDEKEKEDHLVPYVYPRSLLYLVSGILENKKDAAQTETDAEEEDGDYFILGLDRQLKDVAPYQNSEMLRAVRTFFSQPNRLINSPTELGPENTGGFCCSLKHGDFDNDPPMLSSLAYLVTQ